MGVGFSVASMNCHSCEVGGNENDLLDQGNPVPVVPRLLRVQGMWRVARVFFSVAAATPLKNNAPADAQRGAT